MASPQLASPPVKLSFAKVAAMPAPRKMSHNSANPKINTNEPISHRKTMSNVTDEISSTTGTATVTALQHKQDLEKLGVAMEYLAVGETTNNGLTPSATAPQTDSTGDDQSHLSNSSSKPQSFDTKSMASVTTFAMDEKESIRPDDSASVRAVDDDDFVPGQQFQITNQHMAAERAFGARYNPRVQTNYPISTRRYPTLTTANQPRFGDLPLDPLAAFGPAHGAQDLSLDGVGGQEGSARPPTLAIHPDEKLLDALATPKDRLPLLQLEEKVIAFVSQDGDQVLDCPPQNAFTRMLAYKLADYYCLQHQINDDTASVRMFKSHLRTLPTPLHIIAQSIPIGPVAPPGSAAFKIMRRTALGGRQMSAGGSTPASSSVPSKATSDAGGENSDEGIVSPLEGTPIRDRAAITREEREANYKAARERIFGDFQESALNDVVAEGDTSASMSRTSSSSGKRKTHRQRAPKDDSFEARSSFVAAPSYQTMQVPFHPQANQAQHLQEMPFMSQYPSHPGPISPATGFDLNAQYMHGTSVFGSQGMPGPAPSTPFVPGEAWQHSQPGAYSAYGHMSSRPAASYGYNQSSMSSTGFDQQYMLPADQNATLPIHGWMQAQYQNSYSPGQPPTGPRPSHWSHHSATASAHTPLAQSYQYGQLPNHAYATQAAYSSQHPLPGSYTRSLFNPQTRSFIPSNAVNRNGTRNPRKKNNINPGLVRSGSSTNSVASESSSRTPSAQHAADLPYDETMMSRTREESLHQRYGAPPHLPKKPPPPHPSTPFDQAAAAAFPMNQALSSQTRSTSSTPLTTN